MFDLARTIVPLVLPVTASILDHARVLLDRHDTQMARDALHAAVAFQHTGGEICSFDDDFDVVESIRRREPRGEPAATAQRPAGGRRP